MKNVSKKIKAFFENTLAFWIILGAIAICTVFLCIGVKSENGSITLDGKDAVISENITKAMESFEEAIYRTMNEDAPTDEETIKANEIEATGQGAYTTIDDVIARRLPDGDTDNGKGWQCSKYTAYLATGKREYSTAHPDYGPVNGKDVAAYLVKYYGWQYIDKPVEGAIGSGGFNTTYGHTVMYLYSTGTNTAMVNDANFVPLTVATHNMNISGYVWVVPGSYNPEPTPTPAPTPTPEGKVNYSYVPGDFFSKVLVKLGLDEGHLWGENGTVKYYTKQLIEQRVLDGNGNVKLYVPFTLTRR